MKLKQYIATHTPTGGVYRTVGHTPELLCSGHVSLDTCEQAHYVPELDWTPGPEWIVVEEEGTAGS